MTCLSLLALARRQALRPNRFADFEESLAAGLAWIRRQAGDGDVSRGKDLTGVEIISAGVGLVAQCKAHGRYALPDYAYVTRGAQAYFEVASVYLDARPVETPAELGVRVIGELLWLASGVGSGMRRSASDAEDREYCAKVWKAGKYGELFAPPWYGPGWKDLGIPLLECVRDDAVVGARNKRLEGLEDLVSRWSRCGRVGQESPTGGVLHIACSLTALMFHGRAMSPSRWASVEKAIVASQLLEPTCQYGSWTPEGPVGEWLGREGTTALMVILLTWYPALFTV